jgi:hypothetical protein
MQSVDLSPYCLRPNAPGNPSTPCFDGSQVESSSFFNLEFKFLLMHESSFHVIGCLNGSNTHDGVGRVTRNQADFNVAATATSCWILAATSTSRASRPEFQHSSSTFGPGILAITMGTFSWRASPIVGNASMDYTDNAATFFFTIDGKTYSCLSIVTFIIRANIK